MQVSISDLVDGGKVYELEGERSLMLVFQPDRTITHFIVGSDYKSSKKGIVPSMEALTELILWVDGYIDLFPEDAVFPEQD